VLVDRLALVVVLRMRLPIRAGECLCGFVGFEAQITGLMVLSLPLVAKTSVTEHQIVVRLQVFGVYGEHFAQCAYRIGVLFLQELYATQIVQHDAIARVLR
jgi:hypothetical protein